MTATEDLVEVTPAHCAVWVVSALSAWTGDEPRFSLTAPAPFGACPPWCWYDHSDGWEGADTFHASPRAEVR